MEKSELEQLFAVQEVDARLRELRHRLVNLAETSGAKSLAEDLKSLKLSHNSMRVSMESLAKRRDDLEDRSRILMGKVKNIKAKEMSGAISHRDIATTEAEISHLESQRSELEDAEFEVLSEIELLEPQMLDLESRIAERDAELSKLKEQNLDIASGLNGEIIDMDGKRSGLVGGIDAALLKIYDDIYARVASLAVAKVENGNCQGCRLKLSSVEIENVRRALSGDFSRPPTCEQCGRILYV